MSTITLHYPLQALAPPSQRVTFSLYYRIALQMSEQDVLPDQWHSYEYSFLNFTNEINANKLSFLDINNEIINNRYNLSAFRKATDSGKCINPKAGHSRSLS